MARNSPWHPSTPLRMTPDSAQDDTTPLRRTPGAAGRGLETCNEMRRAPWLVAVAFVACSKTGTSNSVAASATPPYEHLRTSAPGPPTYVAADYLKPGHPDLTLAEMSRIYDILGLVKPCQRRLVRYALLKRRGNKNGRGLIFFFAVPRGQGAHVLGTGMLVYFPDTGTAVPMRVDDPPAEQEQKRRLGIQWDIDHQPCP
jgi:hypothetical protein